VTASAGGRVAGLDIEPWLLAIAAQLSARHGLAAETVRADAASTGLPPGSFDLVHERMLLLNVTSPRNVVAEMTRLARPGGVVALQEPDRQRSLGHRPAASRLGPAARRGHRRLPANRSGLPYRPPHRTSAP
jgi:ubiquinone/menaquinone biosynthesis C-methylase UbiE